MVRSGPGQEQVADCGVDVHVRASQRHLRSGRNPTAVAAGRQVRNKVSPVSRRGKIKSAFFEHVFLDLSCN